LAQQVGTALDAGDDAGAGSQDLDGPYPAREIGYNSSLKWIAAEAHSYDTL
jgi:hypothetical protein